MMAMILNILPTSSLLISLPAALTLITVGLMRLLPLLKKPEHYHEKSRKGQAIKMLHDKKKELPKLLLSTGTLLTLIELARLSFKIGGLTGVFIPLSVEVLTSKDQVDQFAYREKEALVYAQIVKDLNASLESDLPNQQWGYQVGRVSKAAIHALLGQVYLTMASVLDENKTENLQQAEAHLSEAYAMRTFGSLTEIPYADVFNVENKNTCKELIFQIQYKQGDQNYRSVIAANNQARGEFINSQRISTGAGGNVKRDLVNDYEQNDLRKEFSIKFAADPQVNDWFITKFRDVSAAAGSEGYGGNDWIVSRYADVMLLLAETKMKLGKDSEAITLLNDVRERAGLPTYKVSLNDPIYKSKYPTLKAAILHERRVELAFENHRWFDLIRNYDAEELVAYFKTKDQADYGNAKISNISTKDRYFPIPFDEYKLNPEKMYQNKGY